MSRRAVNTAEASAKYHAEMMKRIEATIVDQPIAVKRSDHMASIMARVLSPSGAIASVAAV
jgi:hypothetical protein